MTAERWALIESVLRAALERPVGERTAYLDGACGGDEPLRRSVERLLAGEAEPSLASPAEKLLEAGAAELAPGDTLAQYRVETSIGEGGMGAVYQAHDTRLRRKVALKVLRPEAFGDPDRLARLMREARAASALNHPNIVTIYEIGSDRGVDFIALEFVPGDTLARLIGHKGLPLGRALKYASQIASALAAAHRAGIVHRDLKPANIIVNGAGQVKVLDFGLAKWTGGGAFQEEGSTGTIGPRTGTGAVMGTPAYMSPEQAEGKRVDARSDIFSFGVVLYEMVTGKRAFERDSTAATLAAILKEEPRAAGAVAAGVPPELDKILARCLRKDPERRFQHMDDIGVELNELRETSESGVPEPAGRRTPGRSRKLPWIAVLLLAAAAAGVWWTHSRTSVEEVAIPVPLTSYPGTEATPSFSPDGTQVAFAWCKDVQGTRCNVYLKQIGVEPPFRLTGKPTQEFSPAWSPDGRFIAFLRRPGVLRTALILIPQRGGGERLLSEFDLPSHDTLEGPHLAWTPDAKWIAVPQLEGRVCGLFLVSVETGEIRKLTSPPVAGGGMAGDTAPAFSPDGSTLAFARQSSRSDLYLLNLDAGYSARGEPAKLPLDNLWNIGAAWTPDGSEIVFASGTTTNRGLFRLRVGKPGRPRRLAFAPGDTSGPAISLHAGRLAYSLEKLQANIWRVDVGNSGGTPAVPSRFISSTKWDAAPAYSPTGAKIVFVSTRSGTPELWVCDGDGSNAVQVTALGGELPAYPQWSPDGLSIAFWMEQGGRTDIYVVSSNGGPARRLATNPGGGKFPFWSPDGESLYFASLDQQIWKMGLRGGPATQITRSKGDVPQVSPDGQFLYFLRRWEGRMAVWRTSANGGGEERIVDSVHPAGKWIVGRTSVYFFTPPDEAGRSEIHCYDLATRKTRRILTIASGIFYGIALSPDGHTLLFSQIDDAGGDLMLVENFR